MIILLIIVAVVALWLVSVFNSLVSWKNRVREAWSDIDVQLKRRYDLIPNLVETVKGYAAHEKDALEAVISARARAMGASTVKEHAQAENALAGSLKSLFALAEAYPDLKAVSSFTQLQAELSDTENKIQAARRFYNTTVMSFNTKVQSFPTNLVAGILGFSSAEFFELSDAAQREVPKVGFSH
jgi:LemA protein